MVRFIKIAVVLTIALAAILFVASACLNIWWVSAVVAAGNAGMLNTDAAALAVDIRQTLPIGSSRQAIEVALRSRHLTFSFEERSRTIYAGARYLKGSNPIVEMGLSLKFRLDESLHLQGIDSKTIYTGP
jgi:hypothetical protein